MLNPYSYWCCGQKLDYKPIMGHGHQSILKGIYIYINMINVYIYMRCIYIYVMCMYASIDCIVYIHVHRYITWRYVTLHTICLDSHSGMDDHTFHGFFHVLTMALSWYPPVKFRVSLGKALVLVNQTSFQAFLPAGWGLDDPKMMNSDVIW